MNTPTYAAMLTTALLAPLAQADIAWQNDDRMLYAGIIDFDMQNVSGVNRGAYEVFTSIDRDTGSTYAKVENDFRIENTIYKSETNLQVRTYQTSADILDAGGFLNGGSTLTLTERTTFRIEHQFSGSFTDRDEYIVSLTNNATDTEVFSLDAPPASEYSFITLDAGQYTLVENYSIAGTIIPEPRTRSMYSYLAFNVVPAPASLALIAPAGLLATRRRRA